jgi:hypothetical protein
MFYIASTRFNNETYDENMSYRKKSDIPVIYGTSIRIQEKYDVGSLLFVAEMNNEENRIEGIGLIRNTLVYDKKHNIYSNSDYNRYLYKGDYWISRKTILDKDDEIVKICDTVLFKGKSHLKRVSGISVLTNQLFTNWDYKLSLLKEKIRALFIREYSLNGINNILYQNNLKTECANSDFDDGETFEILISVKKRKFSEIMPVEKNI